MALTAKQLRKPKPGRYSDGNGLFLHVREGREGKGKNSQSWTLRVQYNGKRTDYGLGSHLSLAEARERAAIWRKWAKDGLDPRREWAKENAQVPTFEAAARECFEQKILKQGRSGKHKGQWISTLERYAFPRLGNRSVAAIGSPEVLSVLRPIWKEKAVTASRVKQRIGAVLDYAYSQAWRDDATPIAAIAAGLPEQGHEPKHFSAVPYRELPDLWNKLESSNRQHRTAGRTGLALTILTAARPGEVRGMVWSEIDLEGGSADEAGFGGPVWTIPAKRYKTKKPHIIPLSEAAVAILRELRGMFAPEPSDLVIHGAKRGRPISNATMNRTLLKLGYPDVTVHGTARSGFRDWAGEEARARREVCEAALGHKVPGQVERAYARAEYLDERADLMERWAEYLNGVASNVVSLAEAANG